MAEAVADKEQEDLLPNIVLRTVTPIALCILAGAFLAQGRPPSAAASIGGARILAVEAARALQAAWPPDIDPDSRARLPGVKREDLDAEGQRTYDWVVNPTTSYRAGLPSPIGMWMHSPKMARHILPGYLYLRFGGDSYDGMTFDVRLTELIILVTARQVNSQYQWTSHQPTAPKVGLELEIIDVIKYHRGVEGLGEVEALIIRFGRELFGNRRVSSETFSHALEVFGRRGVTELSALMAFYEFLFLSSNGVFDIQMQKHWEPLLPISGERSSRGSRTSAHPTSRAELPEDINPESLARLPKVNREGLDDEGRRIYDAIVNPQSPYSGGLPTPLAMWMHSPKMAEYFLPAYMYLSFDNELGRRLTELAILVTARQINSQYQWTAHEPMALEEGLEPAIIDTVKFRRSIEGLGEEEAVVIRFGRELFEDDKVSSETFARALELFGRAGVADLGALMAFYEFLYLSSNATFDIQMPADWQPLLPTP